MGLLCGQRTRPVGFVEPTPTEIATFYRTNNDVNNTIDVPDGEQTRDESPGREDDDLFEGVETYVRPQNAPFEER